MHFSKLLSNTPIKFPDQRCLLCGDTSSSGLCLCNPCLEELPFIEHACQKCGLPTVEDTPLCGYCLIETPHNHRAVSILHYKAPVDYLIKKLKYHNQLEVADLLGSLLVAKLKHLDWPLPEQIIPVPLHINRLQQRGYNQAVEIARTVSKSLNVPVNLTNCIRTRVTVPQIELSFEDRKNNLENAFEVVHQIPAKHVAIIDDVMTTGSTLNALTDALLQSGIQKVDIWACSRATLN